MKEGGFYSAEDADSQVSLSNPEKREGAFYTWEYDEVLQLLKKPLEGRPRYSQGELICFHYGVSLAFYHFLFLICWSFFFFVITM